MARHPEWFERPAQPPRGGVMTVDFEVAGQRFTALDGGPMLKLDPSIPFFAFVDAPAEAGRLFAAFRGTALDRCCSS